MLNANLQQFLIDRERFWLVGYGDHSPKCIIRGHESAETAVAGNEDSLGSLLHRDANGFLRLGEAIGQGGFFNDGNGNLGSRLSILASLPSHRVRQGTARASKSNLRTETLPLEPRGVRIARTQFRILNLGAHSPLLLLSN